MHPVLNDPSAKWSILAFFFPLYFWMVSRIKESFRTRTNMCRNKWHRPPTAFPSWYFQVWAVSENLAAAKMKGRRLKMRRDVWTRTLSSGSQWGSVYGKASHVLFRGSSGSVLDQGLIERGCDCWFLCLCTSVCSGMKVNLWSPQRAGSIRAYIDCKVQGGKKKLPTLMTWVDRPCLWNI